MKQRDAENTGRADYTVPSSRLNSTFFDTLRWQKPSPGSPNEGSLGGSSMVFRDTAGSNGLDIVIGGYHWPKGMQGMDRHSGKAFWSGNPEGGEAIGEFTAAFSTNGGTVYVGNDATSHPVMAFAAVMGPASFWHNGADANATELNGLCPKVAPDGRIFTHGWCDPIGALTDSGTALTRSWSASSSVSSCLNTPALFVRTNGLVAVAVGRSGWMRVFDGATGAELWSANLGAGTDADPTIDPVNGNIYVPIGFDNVSIVGMNQNGGLLWSRLAQPVYTAGQSTPQRVSGAGCLSHDASSYYFQTVASDGTGRLYAIRTKDGGIKWSFETQSRGTEAVYSSPIVTSNGVVIVGNNDNGVYHAVQDLGSYACLIDSLVTFGSARSSATISTDGLLYLPARVIWSQTNGDIQVPSQQIENLFNAFSLNGTNGSALPAVAGVTGATSNLTVRLSWQPNTNGAFGSYRVYRSEAPFTNIAGITPYAAITNQSSTLFADHNVQSAQAYYYAVVAASAAGDLPNSVVPVGPYQPFAIQWPMHQKDAQNTGRADYDVPTNRMNADFFSAVRWQKRTPGAPAEGRVSSSSMVFHDGVGPNGNGVVVSGYHWPKGVEALDRQTGKYIWSGNPEGGESIGATSPLFSRDGKTIYVANDATTHSVMGFAVATGPTIYRHNGGEPNADSLGGWSLKLGPDGRIFTHLWCGDFVALSDDGSALHQTWNSASSFNPCRNNPAMFMDGTNTLVVSGGRSGVVKCFNTTTHTEHWSVNIGVGTDADATIDPITGNTYLAVGFDSVSILGITKTGAPLWNSLLKPVFTYQAGVNAAQQARGAGCLSHDGNTYYFQTANSDGSGRLYAINSSNGSVKWQFNTLSRAGEENVSCPIVTHNGIVIVGNNQGGVYQVIRDTGSSASLLASLPVTGGDTASCSATLSPDGLLYLPARLNWVQSNGDAETPTQTSQYLFNAFDITADPQISIPDPTNQGAHRGNASVLVTWTPVTDVGNQFSHYAIFRLTNAVTSLAGLTPLATVSNRLSNQYLDTSVTNGVKYFYYVTAVALGGQTSNSPHFLGPIQPVDESDLQVVSMARTPRFPRYDPVYTNFEITEPSGFGPYWSGAATGLGSGQTTNTVRAPTNGQAVTYTATVRNRGTNPWTNGVPANWVWDGVVVSNAFSSDNLAPGALTMFSLVRPWDSNDHELTFFLNSTDARPANNTRTIHAKSVPCLTYVDQAFYEQFISTTMAYSNAVTDDLLDWLNYQTERFNQMFAAASCPKRVHFDVLEVIPNDAVDPAVPVSAFAIFPFRYRANEGGDTRLSGYYRPTEDIDYGWIHELGHQLGLIDIYQMDVPPDGNQVSGLGFSAWDDLMRVCSPFLSPHSALGMTRWQDQAHGYFGQYLYGIPAQMKLRLLNSDGMPIANATVRMFQLCQRPGIGKLISNQIKAEGQTDANGEWSLPNVTVDVSKVPPLPTGDTLKDNPFGYVSVVGANGVLHFQLVSGGQTNHAWLSICEANTAYYRGQTNTAVFERQWSPSGLASQPIQLRMLVGTSNVTINAVGGVSWMPVVLYGSSNLVHWPSAFTNTPRGDTTEFPMPLGPPPQFYRARQ